MSDIVPARQVLAKRPPLTSHRLRALAARGAAESGRSRAGIAGLFLRAMLTQRMFPEEVLDFGLHRGKAAQAATHIGIAGSQRFNMAFNADAPGARALLANKRLYALTLAGAGLRTPKVEAITHAAHTDGPEDLARWLDTRDRPVFGKPVNGYGSEGVLALDPQGKHLSLPGGRRVASGDLAQLIWKRYGDGGYLWMTRAYPHPDLADIFGQTLGCVRLVMVRGDTGPAPLYALMKIPAPQAMADNFWRPGNTLALLDPANGAIRRLTRHHDEVPEALARRLLDTALPDWDAILALARAAADLTPDLGIIGFDIGVSDQGPTLIEANTNPDHRLWQFATGGGFLTADHRRLLTAIRADLKARRRQTRRRRRGALLIRRSADLPRAIETLFRDRPDGR